MRVVPSIRDCPPEPSARLPSQGAIRSAPVATADRGQCGQRLPASPYGIVISAACTPAGGPAARLHEVESKWSQPSAVSCASRAAPLGSRQPTRRVFWFQGVRAPASTQQRGGGTSWQMTSPAWTTWPGRQARIARFCTAAVGLSGSLSPLALLSAPLRPRPLSLSLSLPLPLSPSLPLSLSLCLSLSLSLTHSHTHSLTHSLGRV